MKNLNRVGENHSKKSSVPQGTKTTDKASGYSPTPKPAAEVKAKATRRNGLARALEGRLGTLDAETLRQVARRLERIAAECRCSADLLECGAGDAGANQIKPLPPLSSN